MSQTMWSLGKMNPTMKCGNTTQTDISWRITSSPHSLIVANTRRLLTSHFITKLINSKTVSEEKLTTKNDWWKLKEILWNRLIAITVTNKASTIPLFLPTKLSSIFEKLLFPVITSVSVWFIRCSDIITASFNFSRHYPSDCIISDLPLTTSFGSKL